MSTLAIDASKVRAVAVKVRGEKLFVELSDGRAIAVPLEWYPRLQHASPKERTRWRLIGSGNGIHWPDLDEDISIANLLNGQPSGEGQRSFRNWLARRSGNSLKRRKS